MKRYQVEKRYAERGGPNHSVIVRRPQVSMIAVGVGVGRTLREAVQSAMHEVRWRRACGEFRRTDG